jgi:hypothetical protein
MAFSTTSDHIQTGTNIITEAFELLGVLQAGGTIHDDDKTSALRTLNNLLKAWAADTQIFAQSEYELTLVADDGQYTLDTGNVGYIPNKVLNATIIHNTNSQEIPLTEITQQEWYALTDKTTKGTVTQWYQKPGPVGVGIELYLWPRPANTDWNAKLWLQFNARDVDLIGDDVWIPQEWFLALSYGLAYYISPKWGIGVQERAQIKATMDELKLDAESYNTDGSVYFQPMKQNG